jgi:hypothetical protein
MARNPAGLKQFAAGKKGDKGTASQSVSRLDIRMAASAKKFSKEQSCA